MGKDKGKRYTSEEKAELIGLYEQSGYSVSRFCSEMGLSYATLRRWLEPASSSLTERIELVEVTTESHSTSRASGIRLPNGILIELGEGQGASSIATLARELMAC